MGDFSKIAAISVDSEKNHYLEYKIIIFLLKRIKYYLIFSDEIFDYVDNLYTALF